jgi:hypothetical protein
MNDPVTQAAHGGAAAVGAIRSDLYPIGTDVEVKYPRTKVEEQGDRAAWPWLPGWIVEVCGPDEWQVCVQDYALALTEDGQVPPPGIPEQDLLFPCCFRDSSEIRIRPGAS